MNLVSPVMGAEERDAAVVALRAVVQERILVEHDEDKVRHAVEALEGAPSYSSEVPELTFDGATFDQAKDGKRLTKLWQRVRGVMFDGRWRTLAQLREEAGGSEASVSARLRDLRKTKFGGYTVQRRRLDGGLYAYRVLPPGTPQDYHHDAPPRVAQQQMAAV